MTPKEKILAALTALQPIPLSYGALPSKSLLHPRAYKAGKSTGTVMDELRGHMRRGDLGAAERLLNSLGFEWRGPAPSIEEDVAAVAEALDGEVMP